jgi:hypothetical protein
MAHADTETTLIGCNRLNLQVLQRNDIKIYDQHEDVVEPYERNLVGDAGKGIVEEIPVVLVCETSLYKGEINHTEALETRVNNEFRVSQQLESGL